MTLLNLAYVTQTVVNLLQESVEASPAWSGTNFLVTPQPPDKLRGENTLGVYLYHVAENGHFKNLPPPGQETPPVRYTPMGLDLYYQLSAHSDMTDEKGPYQEQLMMGLAVKTLRDFPIIDDSTEVKDKAGKDIKILENHLRGGNNRLRIVLQPVAHSEAVSYWTAGSSPMRLAAYYQMSVVFLEPETTQTRTGRVLTYGVHAFARGAPRLEGSENTLSFILPGENTPREIKARPAQVPVGDKVVFDGTGLTGDQTHLLLKSVRWNEPVEADQAWSVTASNERVTALVQETATGKDVVPGIYSAVVQVVLRRKMPDRSIRDFTYSSNETPFAITPRIGHDDITSQIQAGKKEVTVKSKTSLFDKIQAGDIPARALQVYVGIDLYEKVEPPSLDVKKFAIVKELPAEPAFLKLMLPDDPKKEEWLSFRLFVNGVESPPNWIKVP